MTFLRNFILLTICFAFGNANSQSLYQNAYNYIRTHPDTQHFYWENSIPFQECIEVSSEVVPLSIVPFFDEFNTDSTSTKKNLEVIDFLETLDENNYFETYYDEALSGLSSCKGDAQATLFFSEISKENTLLAMLFIGEYSSKNFDDIAQFNEGLLFLLHTKNSSGEIKITNSLSTVVRFE